MTRIEKALSTVIEVIVFDIVAPLGCIAVKGREGLREVISRRNEMTSRRNEEKKEEEKKEKK